MKGNEKMALTKDDTKTIKEWYNFRMLAKTRVEELKARGHNVSWYRGHRNFVVQYSVKQEDAENVVHSS
jgi:hypothetical protein